MDDGVTAAARDAFMHSGWSPDGGGVSSEGLPDSLLDCLPVDWGSSCGVVTGVLPVDWGSSCGVVAGVLPVDWGSSCGVVAEVLLD